MKLKKEELFSEVKKISKKKYIYISVLGWNDMDYFKELCEENGGCDDLALIIYDDLPLSKKVFLEEFYQILKKYIKYPILKSNNGKVKFYYDLHMWVSGYYMIYNFHIEKLLIRKMNFFEKIFRNTQIPPWHQVDK